MAPFRFEHIPWNSALFWIGLVFVTFPLNFLIYGLNDFTDGKADTVNPRKGNYIFGPKFSKKELAPVPRYIFFIVSPFLVFFFFTDGMDLFVLVMFMLSSNIMYNYKPFRLKGRPPLDIIMQLGYVALALFSILLNDLEMLRWQTWFGMVIFAFIAQILGGIFDIQPDIAVGKKTSVVLMGALRSKIILLVLICAEAYIMKFWFNDWVMFSLFLGWALLLLCDILGFFGTKPYTASQMKLLGIGFNLFGIFSLLYCGFTGILLQSNF